MDVEFVFRFSGVFKTVPSGSDIDLIFLSPSLKIAGSVSYRQLLIVLSNTLSFQGDVMSESLAHLATCIAVFSPSLHTEFEFQ